MVRETYQRGIRRAVLNIARRWGKSKCKVVMASETCLRTRRARVPYAAMTEGTVGEFIAPHMAELAADAPPELRPEEHRGVWHFPSTDSRIVMRGCEDRKKADRLRGPAATMFIIDEAGFIDVLEYVVKSVAAPQLITTDGMMLLGSSPPLSPSHPFRQFALEAEERGAYMHATIHDAPHLDAAAIAKLCTEMGGVESAAWRREGLAHFIVDESRALVPEFEAVEQEIVEEVPRPQHFDLYAVGDLGYTDLTVILLGWYHFERALLVVEDEVVLRRPTSDVVHREVEARLALRFPGREPLERAVDAPAITVADLRRLQPSIEGRDDDDPARWHAVANDELDAALNAMRLRVSRRSIRIHPRCTHLRAHLRAGVWNEQRTSFARVATDDGVHHYDGVAALIYLNRKLRVERNPAPPPDLPGFGQRVFGGIEVLRKERESKWRAAFGRRAERR